MILLLLYTVVFRFNTTGHSLQRTPYVIIQQKMNTNTLVNDQSQAAVEKIQVLPC